MFDQFLVLTPSQVNRDVFFPKMEKAGLHLFGGGHFSSKYCVFLVMFLRIVPIRPPPCGEANPSNELPNKPLNGEGEGMKSMFCWIYLTVHL